MTAREHDFDVAFSFSGDHRVYVEQVAKGLRRRGYRVFYDQLLRAQIIGQDLITYLQEVYGRRSAMVAAFVSQQWTERPWPGHERSSALAHALLEAPRGLPFLLPFRFDDTPVAGLQPTVGYEDLRNLTGNERRWRPDPRYKHPRHVVELLVDVLKDRGINPSEDDLGEEYGEGVASRLIWVDRLGGVHATGIVPLDEFEDGVTVVFPDEADEGGPIAGSYHLLREDLGAVIVPNDPLPAFLHEAYRGYEKSWVQTLEKADQEALVAEEVKRQVQTLVDFEISQGGVAIGPTFTRGIMGPQGPSVIGICAMARRV